MEININHRLKMKNGNEIPQLGLGVFQITAGQYLKKLLMDAFQLGIRHIDTAKVYGNERTVGEAIRQSNIPRSEIFLTTKLWNSDQGYDSTLRAFDESLKQLGLDYIDLYLIHWPTEDLRLDSWKAMEEIYKSGKVKSIGVSNFMLNHLQELMDSSDIVPVINQIELHPYNYRYRSDLIEFCHENRILIQAYAPLTRGHRLDDPKLVEISNKYHKTAAQLLIRWALQQEMVVIPKSAKFDRIKENTDVFDFSISKDDMDRIDAFNEDLLVCWDPSEIP